MIKVSQITLSLDTSLIVQFLDLLGEASKRFPAVGARFQEEFKEPYELFVCEHFPTNEPLSVGTLYARPSAKFAAFVVDALAGEFDKAAP